MCKFNKMALGGYATSIAQQDRIGKTINKLIWAFII